MATFVLVHGAWRGGWVWKRVRPPLARAGHDVFTPTLTGVADRSHLNAPSVDLETHIADVMNLIRWEELDDVVLCGHSYAGCVVTGVADRLPERIRALVYLDAFVPENGQSLHDGLPPEQRAAQVEGARQRGDGWQTPPIPAQVFNVGPEDRAWVDAQGTMQSLATFQQPLRLTGGIDRVRRSYVLATDFPGTPFRRFYERAEAKGWKTSTVACGHDVMLACPDETVRLLLEAAESA
jgi:pimeloyl-ACP methyl ester carboxylesterase